MTSLLALITFATISLFVWFCIYMPAVAIGWIVLAAALTPMICREMKIIGREYDEQ